MAAPAPIEVEARPQPVTDAFGLLEIREAQLEELDFVRGQAGEEMAPGTRIAGANAGVPRRRVGGRHGHCEQHERC